jgi:hypothetical protein
MVSFDGPGVADDVLDHLSDGDDLIAPLANGEPTGSSM